MSAAARWAPRAWSAANSIVAKAGRDVGGFGFWGT